MTDEGTARRRRGWIITVVVVLVVGGGLMLGSYGRRQSSRRVDQVRAALLTAYRPVDVGRLHTTYQDREIASATGTPDLSMFPTVAHASLVRATFPHPSSVRAVYQVDASWAGNECITVEVSGTGSPSAVDASVGGCR